MKDDLDRQANAVYRAVSALGTPGKLRDIEAVRAFVGRVTDDLGIEPIAVKEVDEAPPMAEQPEPIRSHAFVKAGERSIYVANLSRPMLSQQVLILHEIAHILTPTWPEGHGLDWARTFVDLVDRFWWLASDDIRLEFALKGVVVADEASEWADPREWGKAPHFYPPH